MGTKNIDTDWEIIRDTVKQAAKKSEGFLKKR